jgi:hypothetical protein
LELNRKDDMMNTSMNMNSNMNSNMKMDEEEMIHLAIEASNINQNMDMNLTMG